MLETQRAFSWGNVSSLDFSPSQAKGNPIKSVSGLISFMKQNTLFNRDILVANEPITKPPKIALS